MYSDAEDVTGEREPDGWTGPTWTTEMGDWVFFQSLRFARSIISRHDLSLGVDDASDIALAAIDSILRSTLYKRHCRQHKALVDGMELSVSMKGGAVRHFTPSEHAVFWQWSMKGLIHKYVRYRLSDRMRRRALEDKRLQEQGLEILRRVHITGTTPHAELLAREERKILDEIILEAAGRGPNEFDVVARRLTRVRMSPKNRKALEKVRIQVRKRGLDNPEGILDVDRTYAVPAGTGDPA